jgi:hypothetical protein
MMGQLLPELNLRQHEHARTADRANREAWKFQDVREVRGRGLRERISGILARPGRQVAQGGV